VLHKVSVDLPKKHGRGGQSALRFARLRLEKRQNYVRKIAELTTQLFITDDRPNVNGLIMAGSADFKNQLLGSDLFDQRLQPHILMIVDVSYGGENGFLSCLEMGAIETLIVWEDLAVERCVLLNSQTQEEHIHFFTQEQQADDKNMKDPETGVDLELTDKIPMMEWLANEYKNFGCSLEFITDRSEEGSQFVRGFGGIGGILRYQVNLADFEVASDHDDDSDEYSSDGEGYI
jgi:peptide chain release factor subunit 1